MIQTVARNSRPKRPRDCSIPFEQNIRATSRWLQQLPPILTEAKTAGCADGISGQGTRLDLSADIQYYSTGTSTSCTSSSDIPVLELLVQLVLIFLY